uniref:Protein TsetseEP domain-containing protein n=1 Tax=Clastoptera arizonana TaxID=38151 RepID=A0A1B6CGQ6_9HEMI
MGLVLQSAVILLIFSLKGFYIIADDIDSDEYLDLSDCKPKLADKCFRDVYANLQCHTNLYQLTKCNKMDISDLCSGLSDALNCSSEIVDEDCSLDSGIATFDSWLGGLKAVYSNLCDSNNKAFKALMSTRNCWDGLLFVKCLENKTGISHVVDMLHVLLDQNECNRILISMSTCNVQATTNNGMCNTSQEVISEAIHSFFTKTKCGSICNTSNLINTSSLFCMIIVLYTLIKFV